MLKVGAARNTADSTTMPSPASVCTSRLFKTLQSYFGGKDAYTDGGGGQNRGKSIGGTGGLLGSLGGMLGLVSLA